MNIARIAALALLLAPGAAMATDATVPEQAGATAPVAISMPTPAYPQEAIRAGVKGKVRVEFVVTSEGTVETVRVLESSGSKTLDDAVGNGALRWKFEPACYPDGTPTIAVMRTTITFDL